MTSDSPRRGAIALCTRNILGLITSKTPQEVTYRDGGKAMAWTGVCIHPEEFAGRPWSSRTPRVVAFVDLDLVPEPTATLPLEERPGNCSVCGQPQFNTTSGVSCPNGHGGADSVSPPREPFRVNQPPIKHPDMRVAKVDHEAMLRELCEIDQGLTDWEVGFIDSLTDWIKLGRQLTPRQAQTLERIHDKHC